MTVTATTFARDAGERALKTAIQAGIPAAIVIIGGFEDQLSTWAKDNSPAAIVVLPVIFAALSIVTSRLSRLRGDPNSASSAKAG